MPSIRGFLVAFLLLCATPASSATLTVMADKALYRLGETITLSFVGDAEGQAATQFFAQVEYDDALVSWASTTQTQATHNGGIPWVVGGATERCNFGLTPGWCPVFDQIAGLTPVVPDDLLHSTIRFTAEAIGLVSFTIPPEGDTRGDSRQLIFFGLREAQGADVIIGTSISIIPEPSTATLVSLGLLAIAHKQRTRAR